MELLKTTIDGLTRFETAQTLDLSQLPEGVIKIDGGNGSGKTTLLEGGFYAPLFGGFISRPDLLQSALHKDRNEGKIELHFLQNNKHYRSLIQIERGRTPEGYIYADDSPVVKGKITDLKRYIVENIFSPSVFTACVFRSQNGAGNFLELPKAERKDLFIKLLNQEILEKITRDAAEQVKNIEPPLMQSRMKKEALMKNFQDSDFSVDKRKALLEDIVSNQIPKTQEKLKQCQQEASDLIKKLSEADQANKSIHKYQQDLADLKKQQQEVILELTTCSQKKSQAEAILGNKDAIDQACTSLENSKSELVDLEAFIAEIEAAINQENEIINQAKTKYADLQREIVVLKTTIENKTRNIEKLNGLPCTKELQTKCKFASDAVQDQQEIKAINKQYTQKLQELAVVSIDTTRLQKLKTNLQSKKDLKTEISADIKANETILQQEAQIQIAENNLKATDEEIPKLQTKISEYEEKIEKLQAEISSFAALDITELEAQKLDVELNQMEIQTELNDLNRQLAQYQTEIQTYERISGELAELTKQIDTLSVDLADWQHIAVCFGKNGIQAIEIDNAGPAVSHLANDLLHSCYGNRFSIKFITTSPKADGKGEKEVFDLIVFDTEQEKETKVESLSGGEKVYISIAIQLATAIFLNQSSGIKTNIIILDECLGALTEENAAVAIQMLRRAKEVMGVKHILFVAHLDALRDLCDGVVRIENGKILTERRQVA